MDIGSLDSPSTGDFVSDSIDIVRKTQESAHRSVNVLLIACNWLLGRRITEEEMIGGNSENYGKSVVKTVSEELTREFGKGYSERNLYSFIRFYRMFPDILQSLIAKSPVLTWTHYFRLISVKDDDAREWYHRQALEQDWSVRTLDRNISTQYYHRLLRTQVPGKVEGEMRENTAELQRQKRLEFIKNPVVAEFMGLSPDTDFTETDLETAILDNMQRFLLEMGRGYAFVSRQHHIRTELSDYYIDLVFFNYELNCFVLVDLKAGMLTHQDIGQMDMYVRMYDERMGPKGKNPTLGVILCSETDADVVHYSVLDDRDQLFTAKYVTYLPSKEELRAEIEAQKALYRTAHPDGGRRLGPAGLSIHTVN